MDRKGTLGGGPGSAPGERRKDRCEGPGACMVTVALTTDSRTGPSPSFCFIAGADGCVELDCEGQVVTREERRDQGRGETGAKLWLNHRLGLDAAGAEAKESVKSEAGSGGSRSARRPGWAAFWLHCGISMWAARMLRLTISCQVVWFGLDCRGCCFWFPGFWFQQLSRHGLSPAVMPGQQNPWRHEEPPKRANSVPGPVPELEPEPKPSLGL